MTGLSTYLTMVFDRLYEVTSNETVEERPYADTRSRESLYAITDTQSRESTYAAGEFQIERAQGDTAESRTVESAESFDCEDPRTCPTCSPDATSAD
jgi:hypothetical protein